MPGKVKGQKHEAGKLSAAEVANLTAPGRYLDGRGLFLQVDATGAKRWLQRIMVAGKRRDLGIGPLEHVTLAEARKAAKDNKALALKRIDPGLEREKRRATPTFDEAAAAVIAIKATELRNPKHLDQWRSTIAAYASPVFGHRKVSEVTRDDVLRALSPIWRDRTETATRLRGRIETVLDWAAVSGHRTGDNPARWKGNLEHLMAAPGKIATKGHHSAVAQEDVPAWWLDLTKQDGAAARALEMVTLTWCRSGEVRGMTWAEVNLDAALWVIPGARMKAGREHRVPLVPEAVDLLKRMPKTPSPYVFAAARGGMLSDMALSMTMRRMHVRAELDREVMGGGYFDPQSGRPAVPHGLRSTARVWAAERGYARDMAELALAHDVGSDVERAYRRSDMLDARRQMMTDWAAFLTGRLTKAKLRRVK